MILSIFDKQELDSNLVGVKAKNLNILKKNNFEVSKGILLTTQLYENYKKEGKITNLQEIYQKISDVIGENKKLILRSSANFEDSNEASFAGVYESYLDIKLNNLEETILKIYSSLISEKSLAYYKKNNIDQNKVKMAIIIQEMVNCKISGVCFTKNPITQNKELVVEYVKGSNQKFVSGVEAAERIVFNEILESENKNELKDEEKIIKNNLNIFLEIEKIFKSAQDIEWGVDENNKLFIFQARPIIFQTKTSKDSNLSLKVIAHGDALSAGIKSGKLIFLNTDLKFQELKNSINKNSIIFADRIRVDQILALENAGGVIVTETSLLSHTAIQAREFGIPCVGGIYEKNLFTEGQILTIDGTKGLIFEGKVENEKELENFDIETNYQNFPTYLNLDLIKIYKTDTFEFLYCIQNNEAMIYLPKVENQEMIKKSSDILNQEFKIPLENIHINKIKIYEGPYAASSAYSYYEDYLKVKNNSELNQIFEEARMYMENLDLVNFKNLSEKTRNITHELFLQGYNLFEKFKETKNPEQLQEAAVYFDRALNYLILFSNVIVFSFGNYYLEKHLKKISNISLNEFFSKPDFPNLEIKEFANLLTYYKNKELEPMQANGVTFIDVLDYIYSNDYGHLVEKYRW